MITKADILSEIARTAKANGGVPLGRSQFFASTGIKKTDCGRYWARWGDAIREAGLTPNKLKTPYPDDYLLERLATMTRELGRVPTSPEIRLRHHRDKTFPDDRVFDRIGRKRELVAKLIAFCQQRPEYDDVLGLCLSANLPERERGDSADSGDEKEVVFGYVYLLKSGRFYKIGRSNAVGRRERELAIQLPEKAAAVHSIKTDDPPGIEDYWHRRFADRRKNGEWFELTARDVTAFKRRKFM